MDEDKITITDSNYRAPMDDKMSRELEEYSHEKLRRAEEKEQAMFDADWAKHEKRVEKRKKFFAAIKNIFVKKNNDMQQQNDQNQR